VLDHRLFRGSVEQKTARSEGVEGSAELKSPFSGFGIGFKGNRAKTSEDTYDSTTSVDIDAELRFLGKKYSNRRIVVAIDDIERRADLASIETLIDDLRSLRDYGISFIVPGHPINPTSLLQTKASGILFPVEIAQLDKAELIEVIFKNLELGRTVSRTDCYPFDTEATEYLAEKFSNPDNTVREFVVACQHVLEEAASICHEHIMKVHVEEVIPRIGKRIFAAVDNQDQARRMIRILRENGGKITEDSHYEIIERLLNRPGGFDDAVNELRSLVNSNLVIETNDAYQRSLKINDRFLDSKTLEDMLLDPDSDKDD
jgi:hypothetical protein